MSKNEVIVHSETHSFFHYAVDCNFFSRASLDENIYTSSHFIFVDLSDYAVDPFGDEETDGSKDK